MPNYKRTYQGGGIFFFTLVTYNRNNLFSQKQARELLREAIAEEKTQHPFDLVAMVLLPDHLHCIWELPENDADFSKRWGRIKSSFSNRWINIGGKEGEISQARKKHRERGIWQKGFGNTESVMKRT